MFKTFEFISRKTCRMMPKTPGKLVPCAEKIRCYSKDFNVMSKFLSRGSKKRSTWHTTPERPASLPLPTSIAKGPQSNKRVVVLNKLFMKHITDLMASGKGAGEISGLGIEVTKVKVGAEFNVVNVFWVSTGRGTEENVAAVLKNTARYLRQELSNLRVMGTVPVIQFVRDRTVASWAAVEAVLATADFGEDFQPRGVESFKSDFGNDGNLNSYKSLEKSLNEDLPPMRQNVLGLNRADIMDRLTAAMKGKQALPQRSHKSSTQNALYEPFDEEAFSQFLLQRKIMKDRILKESRREPTLDDFDNFDDSRNQTFEDDEDYIEEEDDDKPVDR